MRAEILVTGGGGLLGHAVRQICPEAIFVTSQDFDLRDACEAERLFETYDAKAVLHLAARVGGVKMNAEKNAELFADNVKMNVNVLSAAHKRGVSRLVSILSTCAFPDIPPDTPGVSQPLREEDLHRDLPYVGNLGYGVAKRMLDLQTRMLWQQYGAQFSSFTPVTMYGPNDNWDLDTGHVVAALIHKCFLAKRDDKALEVWGSGAPVRQFVFAHDVARLLLQEVESFWGPETVILAPDSGLSIRDLAHEIARALSFRGPIVFDATKPEGQRRRVLQSQRLASRFPDFQFTSLEEGLKSTIDWFQNRWRMEPGTFISGAWLHSESEVL